jgi:hypothetical protein
MDSKTTAPQNGSFALISDALFCGAGVAESIVKATAYRL